LGSVAPAPYKVALHKPNFEQAIAPEAPPPAPPFRTRTIESPGGGKGWELIPDCKVSEILNLANWSTGAVCCTMATSPWMG